MHPYFCTFLVFSPGRGHICPLSLALYVSLLHLWHDLKLKVIRSFAIPTTAIVLFPCFAGKSHLLPPSNSVQSALSPWNLSRWTLSCLTPINHFTVFSALVFKYCLFMFLTVLLLLFSLCWILMNFVDVCLFSFSNRNNSDNKNNMVIVYWDLTMWLFCVTHLKKQIFCGNLMIIFWIRYYIFLSCHFDNTILTGVKWYYSFALHIPDD